jgi:cobalt/nickel transport system permease protein
VSGRHAPGGLGNALYRPGDSLLHQLPAHCKLLAVLAFTVLVVATPAERGWAFAGHAALLAAAAGAGRIPAGFLARRTVIELPFVLFALLIPFLATGPQLRIPLLGIHLSEPGLLAAWNILAKATLGTIAVLLLAATTPLRELLLGLERLRMPRLLVQIAQFMLRYTDVVAADSARMRIARESRGFAARNARQLPVVAKSAGALFIRSYERGERVHLAMLSRGYTGSMPQTLPQSAATPTDWVRAALLPLGAAVCCALARTTG